MHSLPQVPLILTRARGSFSINQKRWYNCEFWLTGFLASYTDFPCSQWNRIWFSSLHQALSKCTTERHSAPAPITSYFALPERKGEWPLRVKLDQRWWYYDTRNWLLNFRATSVHSCIGLLAALRWSARVYTFISGLWVPHLRQEVQTKFNIIHTFAHSLWHSAISLSLLREAISPKVGHEEAYLCPYR